MGLRKQLITAEVGKRLIATDKAQIPAIITRQHPSVKAKESSHLCYLCTDKIQASKSGRHTVGVLRSPKD